MASLTLYYDGLCPLCATEMARLRRWDRVGRLAFVDIALPGFDPSFLGVDMAALGREMHSRTDTGEILIGLDSIQAAYTSVGRGWLVWPLRIRALRGPLGSAYRSLARNRLRVSRWLGMAPVPACSNGHCTLPTFHSPDGGEP